ncbi:cytochrome b5 domain-containing protein 1 isoform X1 [Plodia interpunctella]|uniref:cytochrome b5 domain-containing protein 1 isoform X1 n=1 Tax=Plodia interpunctella TaxID=58824 RepID=UPI0023684CD1|nr:cytochrome b5 domain-containing protein 1 isoform X1 [Plodia interpunctella]
MIYTTQEWYTPAEVAIHNKSSDCWVSLNGKVLNLTPWLEQQFRMCRCQKNCCCPVKNWYCSDDCVEYCPCFKRGFFYCDGKRLAMTVVAYAGKDISHWFKSDEWVQYVHPIVGTRTPFMQHGPDKTKPVVPSTRWRPVEDPWWLDEKYVVGKATAKTRPIRIVNTLTGSTVTLEVCSEETIYQIMMRYLPHNGHMQSYTWRYLGKGLCYDKNLTDNGVLDDRERFADVNLAENNHIPALLIYYNDDHTEDPTRDDCFCHEFICMIHKDQKCR